MTSWRGLCFAAAGLALLAVASYGFVFDLGLLGWDSYPMILTARIASIDDFIGTFTEELMDGRYPGGHWYRPVTNLFIAADFAMWGISATGYHATDLLILIANALLLATLTTRLGGGPIAALTAAGLFVIHPIQLEIVPAVPRRADTLCLAFSLACVLTMPDRGRPATRWRAWLNGALGAAAAGAKETGAVAALLCVAWAFVRDSHRPAHQRLGHAMRASAPAIAGIVIMLVARTLSLGGLGGPPNALTDSFGGLHFLAFHYTARLVYPQPFLTGNTIYAWVCITSTGLLAACIALSRITQRTELRGGLQWLAVWAVGLFALSSLAPRPQEWYAVLFVAPYAIALGLVVELSWRSLRDHPARAFALAVFPTLLIGTHLRYSGLLTEYPQWSQADSAAHAVLRQLDLDLPLASAGDRILVPSFIGGIPTLPGDPGVRSAATFWDYGVQAYAELTSPSTPVRVIVDPEPTRLPRSNRDHVEIVLVAEPI